MEKSFKKSRIIFVPEHAYAQFVEFGKVLLINFSSCSFSKSDLIYKMKNTIAVIIRVKHMMFSPNIVKFFQCTIWDLNGMLIAQLVVTLSGPLPSLYRFKFKLNTTRGGVSQTGYGFHDTIH